MTPNKINQACQLRFTVLDVDDSPVTGLLPSSFVVRLYDPADNEVSGSYTIVRKELGNGDYEALFTTDVLGRWYIVVTHPIYFKWGKAAEIICSSEDVSSIAGELTNIENKIDSVTIDVTFIKDIEGGRWEIDGHQMVFYKDDNTTEVARFDLTFDGDLNPIERERA